MKKSNKVCEGQKKGVPLHSKSELPDAQFGLYGTEIETSYEA